jgi:hypothetical protein
MQIRTQRHDGGSAQLSVKPPHDAAVRAPDLDSTRSGASAHHVGQAELVERRQGIRCEQESEPQLTRRGGALVDSNLPAGAPQGGAGGKAADACTDDESR